VAAITLAAKGVDVTLLERTTSPGGKLQQVAVGGLMIDVGPTVLTMCEVFEEIFADAGATFGDHVTVRPLDVLARHAWASGERIDLFSDIDRSVAAIGAFAGAAEGARYRRFCDDTRRIYATLDVPFIRAGEPSLLGLIGHAGGDLLQIKPFTTMWQALRSYFHDPRLQQLFGRYATYCGASPFWAPATLMLIAHVERKGVWSVDGGMQRIAAALAALAMSKGAMIRYGADVREVVSTRGRIAGIRLAGGETIEADAVVVNADIAAIADGRLGPAIQRSAPRLPLRQRSLSAMTWAVVAQTQGFPLLRHNVFFSSDYAAEFDDVFRRGRLPERPTVYVCAQERTDRDVDEPHGAEPLLCLINAPPLGDVRAFDEPEVQLWEDRTFAHLERCGLLVHRRREATAVTTPTDFDRKFPATGGALYGMASHGWTASFRRPGVTTRVPGLYLAGGSVHPGPGVPMAALSGRMAAMSLLSNLASTSPSRLGAMRGGTSTRSATTGATASH